MTTRRLPKKATQNTAPKFSGNNEPEDENPPVDPDENEPDENTEEDSSDEDNDTDPEDVNDAADPVTPQKIQEDPSVVEIRKYPGAPKGHHVVGPDGPITVHGVVIGKLVRLTQPVVQARQLRGSSRWRFHQLYAKGSEIPLAQVQVLEEQQPEAAVVPTTSEIKSFSVKGNALPEIKQD